MNSYWKDYSTAGIVCVDFSLVFTANELNSSVGRVCSYVGQHVTKKFVVAANW
jgi:hypothetical protein